MCYCLRYCLFEKGQSRLCYCLRYCQVEEGQLRLRYCMCYCQAPPLTDACCCIVLTSAPLQQAVARGHWLQPLLLPLLSARGLMQALQLPAHMMVLLLCTWQGRGRGAR